MCHRRWIHTRQAQDFNEIITTVTKLLCQVAKLQVGLISLSIFLGTFYCLAQGEHLCAQLH